MINDILLEVFNALLIAGIILYQLVNNRYRNLSRKPGARLILTGFCLMLLGACLDITDEFPQLNHFIIIGENPVEAFIEKFLGYLLGSLLLLLGFSRILPVFSELEEKRQLIETIVETIPAPTFCKDAGGRYLACNRAFEEFIGVPRSRILGRTVYDISPATLAKNFGQADRDLLEEGGRQIYESQVQAGDGTVHDVIFHKAVYRQESGEAGGIVGVLLDISERKTSEEALRRLDKMKSEFIGTAAHELRTPLASVQGYTELLLAQQTGKNNFSAEQCADFLNEICQACDALATLVDDLLDIGRIENGRPLTMNIQPDNPEPLLRKVVEAFRLRNPQQPIILHYAPGPDLLLPFDFHRLRQVLENLLSNAVKYSPERKPIEVTIQLQGTNFVLQVRDQGLGMSADQCAKIYEKFYRADPEETQISGLGLGMSVVRSIVEAHGGHIHIESQPARGTLVEVTLPLSA